jgi:hypothetical protein
MTALSLSIVLLAKTIDISAFLDIFTTFYNYTSVEKPYKDKDTIDLVDGFSSNGYVVCLGFLVTMCCF